MRIILSFILSTITLSVCAQMVPESFVHCLDNDTLLIEKISESVSGDTVIKEFRDHVFDPNDSFNYYFFNDSVFIKYHGEFYIIGDNNAVVGDVWHPIRFNLMSYSDTTESCPKLMNLQVVAVDTVTIDGQPTRYFSLRDLDWETPTPVEHKFLAGIGATGSGPLYNLSQQITCNVFTHYSLSFRSYQVDDFEYIENRCITSVKDTEDPTAIHAYPNPATDYITVSLPQADKATLRLYDTVGRTIRTETTTSPQHTMDLSALPSGIYLLNVQTTEDRSTRSYRIMKK